MQGFTTDGEYIYWSFTDSVVKTNLNNTVIAQVHVNGGHLGDIDYHGGKLYSSYMTDAPAGAPWDGWEHFFIYVYDAETLALEKKIELPACAKMKKAQHENAGFLGIDGVVVKNGKGGEPELWVAGGTVIDDKYDRQMIFRFSFDGELLETKYIKTGNTTFGIQNLEYEEDTGCFWFSTYGSRYIKDRPMYLFCVDLENEKIIAAYDAITPYGFHACGGGKYLVGFHCGRNGNCSGHLYPVTLDEIKENRIYKFKSIP